MKIQQIRVEDLIPYEKNPRINDDAVIPVMNSIKEFGFKVPIVVDSNNVIVAGHTRWKASLELGLDTVPCIVADDLTEEQVKAFRLADNKTHELADWDFDLLLDELNDLDFDMEQFGFEKEIQEREVVEDEYEVIEPEEAKSKYGDIYQLGNHRVMCGDSTSEEDMHKLLDETVVDLVVTDPPYNVDYGSKAEAINKYGYQFSDRKIMNDYMPDEEFVEFLESAFFTMTKHLKAGGSFYIFHASITVHEFEMALKLNNLQTRQQLIWVKNALVLGRQDYQWIHEPALYGWKGGAGHYFTFERTHTTVYEEGKPDLKKLSKKELIELVNQMWEETPKSIIREDKPQRSVEHPTMKPLKLLGHLIRNSSREEENVLDQFGGSGSTLMACEQLNRNAYLMELDPKFVDVIIDRWETFTGEKAVKINE